MEKELTTQEVNAALAAVRRRARYLAEAEGSWSWSEVLNLLVPFGVAGYFTLKGAANWPGEGLVGLVLVVSAVGGWQLRRLRARVDALTRLLTEIGFPDAA